MWTLKDCLTHFGVLQNTEKFTCKITELDLVQLNKTVGILKQETLSYLYFEYFTIAWKNSYLPIPPTRPLPVCNPSPRCIWILQFHLSFRLFPRRAGRTALPISWRPFKIRPRVLLRIIVKFFPFVRVVVTSIFSGTRQCTLRGSQVQCRKANSCDQLHQP